MDTMPTDDTSPRPVAFCRTNEVAAFEFPFYLKPAEGFEPAYIFLEDHLYNLERGEIEALGQLVRIESEEDLRQWGYLPDEDGVFFI